MFSRSMPISISTTVSVVPIYYYHIDSNCMAKFGSLPGPKTYVHGESAPLANWRGKGVIHMSP